MKLEKNNQEYRKSKLSERKGCHWLKREAWRYRLACLWEPVSGSLAGVQGAGEDKGWI